MRSSCRVAKLAIGLALAAVPAVERVQADVYRYELPLMLSAGSTAGEGFARVANRSARAGTVRIHAIDEAGTRFGPVEFALDANAVAVFSSVDLESGMGPAGLSWGVGAGQGDWRLDIESDLDISPQAFARAPDGAVIAMNDVETVTGDGRCYIPYFDTHSDSSSWLRLINTGGEDVEIAITGLNDRGQSPPEGEIRLTLPANRTRMLSAAQLETGTSDVRGRFGDGFGVWRLFVSSDRSIRIMNLLKSAGGGLVRLSDCAGVQNVDGTVFLDSGLGVGDVPSDPYELIDAHIAGDSLDVTVAYGGGCETHDFTLHVSDAFMPMDPVRVRVKLVHGANGDPCEAWLTEKLSFDLTPIREAYGQAHGVIVLLLDNAPGGELRYEF